MIFLFSPSLCALLPLISILNIVGNLFGQSIYNHQPQIVFELSVVQNSQIVLWGWPGGKKGKALCNTGESVISCSRRFREYYFLFGERME